MNGKSLALVLTLVVPLGTAHADVGDYGRNQAAACSSCHGLPDKGSGLEPLAGYPKDKLLQAMQDFRSGAKRATVMQSLAKGYSDAQVTAIAGFLAGQNR
jgi:cytochrome subunit of sulfide dehydrogenase